MSIAHDAQLDGVVALVGQGKISISDEEHPYIIMELCDCHLGEVISARKDLYGTRERVELALRIVAGIRALNDLDIYHRDIKFANILFKNDMPLIADLGLADYRNSEILIEEAGDKIGPIGWLSPEAVNKWLTEKDNPYSGEYDCKIDSKSDVFQLGKLIWYIMQGNLPIGLIDISDLVNGDQEIFEIIQDCLLHNKTNRISIELLEERLSSWVG